MYRFENRVPEVTLKINQIIDLKFKKNILPAREVSNRLSSVIKCKQTLLSGVQRAVNLIIYSTKIATHFIIVSLLLA
jgi:hypothetical protein